MTGRAHLLSVVMPTHDRARELARAAGSVLTQDVDDLELVVVDDCSSDDTPDVLDRLASGDARVRVVRTDRSLGPCEARNRGLAVARGDLVSFCDDDDGWFPGIGRELVGFLDEHPSVVAVSSWHLVLQRATGNVAVFRGPLRFGADELLWLNCTALPFAVLRRPALSFEVGFDPDLPTGEDWELFLRCALEGEVCSVPRVGYLYTQHPGSRVTRTADAQAVGRRNFVAKHGARMTPACRLYHDAVVAGFEHGRPGMARRLRPGRGARPADVARVGALLATSAVAARLGQRRRDPGLPTRVLTRLVGDRRG